MHILISICIFSNQIYNSYERFCSYILGYLVADGSIEESIRKENRKITDYWSLHFSYNIKVRKPIFDYLYKDATVFLKRKRDKALNTVLNAVDKRTAQCNA